MSKKEKMDESLLREVVGDDKNDEKRKTDLNEDEWIRIQRTGGGAET